MLLGYRVNPRPNSRTRAIVLTIGLLINRCSYSKNEFDERKLLTDTEVWAAATCNFDTIQARPPFFLLEWVKKKTKGGSVRRVDI